MSETQHNEQPITSSEAIEAHAGVHAVAVARAHGVETMFTLSGAHVFPMYDGAVNADPPMRILDVRHEQTATFAAEATGKLTRTPGLAVLTAGPGVTNGVSAVAQAQFAGSPLVVVGGRAPANRWGTGSLQELDQPPILAPVTKLARTLPTAADVAAGVHEAFTVAGAPHRGPVFVDVPMDEFFSTATSKRPGTPTRTRIEPDGDALAAIGELLGSALQPVLVIGTDVWADGAEDAALRLVDGLGLPAITNGMGRGIIPGGHPLLVTKARGQALNNADLVIVAGTALDFRLGYGVFGGKDGTSPARVVHLADSPGQISGHAELTGSAAGDLTLILDGLREAVERRGNRPDWSAWVESLQQAVAAAAARDADLLTATADPIHPARIYGELLPRLADDSIVIGDGGDFVSFAGKFVEPKQPGGWLDPGPYGCLGAGLGAAIAARLHRPSAQVVLLLGDGAAGMSLMDVDTLVRHQLPVVMVCGNNSAWGLEKQPMQMLYGYDVAADLAPRTAYDGVVTALGGAGETVTDPGQIGAALDRAFAANVPYLVNVITDVNAPYPRSTFGI
ncbi:acetolactate synthase [Gordonia sp. CPCC 205515]|uniref:acetolactate synthase n=1 Tax=Gordonia sp. CPCC 205515 TaxID=3140791 RepID=UPI003AF3DBE9